MQFILLQPPPSHFPTKATKAIVAVEATTKVLVVDCCRF